MIIEFNGEHDFEDIKFLIHSSINHILGQGSSWIARHGSTQLVNGHLMTNQVVNLCYDLNYSFISFDFQHI